jgi:hypothetical protein
MLETLADQVNSNPALVRRGGAMSASFLIEIGARGFHVSVDRGRITGVEEGPFIMRGWNFAIRAPEAVWEKFWEPFPDPGFQDIFAMNRFGHCVVEGDVDVLMANLRYVKDVLVIPRRKPNSAPKSESGHG